MYSEKRGTPQVPANTLVYAVGDIHGRLDLLEDILAQITRHSRLHPQPTRRLVFLGDYVSRGPDSRGVIDRLLNLGIPGFEAIFLKGNHEDVMLRFLAGDLRVGAHWIGKGGDAALRSYGVRNDAGRADREERLESMRKRFLEAMPAEHLQFLRELAYSHREGDYYFVHAGIRPGVALDEQSERDRMWIRRRFHLSEEDHGAIIVHGHDIVPEVSRKANRIAIDTGASRSGRLSCLALHEDRCRILATGNAEV